MVRVDDEQGLIASIARRDREGVDIVVGAVRAEIPHIDEPCDSHDRYDKEGTGDNVPWPPFGQFAPLSQL